jgi:dienelactone hydrolase
MTKVTPARRSRLYLWLALALVLALIGGVVLWLRTPQVPMAQALVATDSDNDLEVRQRPWLTFRPQRATPKIGLIFYPGARVDPVAYAPTARAIAQAGYLVVITPMPANLAVLAPEKATQVMAVYPEIERWVIGGHSLGGAMAARYAFKHPEAVHGLALWAAYPAANNDLSAARIPVLSLYGTLDGLTTPPQDRGFQAVASAHHHLCGHRRG